MLTFRKLMTVGALAGITLFNIGVSDAVELPSETHSSANPASKNQPQLTKMSSPASVQVQVIKVVTPSITSINTDKLPTKAEINAPIATEEGVSKAAQLVNPQPPVNIPKNPAPEYLNPKANPLLFPTKPEEVQVEKNQENYTPITLQQALELAKRNNKTLQNEFLTLEGTKAALQTALAAQYPTLNLSAEFDHVDSASSSLNNAITALSQANLPSQFRTPPNSTISDTFNGTLQLSYDVYTSGQRAASIRAAEKQVRLEELKVEQQSEQLRLDVTNDYYNLQQQDEQVKISEAAIVNSQRSLKDASDLERAGIGTKFDVLQAEVQLANAQQTLVQAKNNQNSARRQLVQRLSLSQKAEVKAADPIQKAGVWNLPLEDSIILAFKNRAELEQQLTQREINDQNRIAALAAVKPTVSIFANYNILNVLDDQVGPTDGYTIGAKLQWNLYDGGAARSRAKQQEVNKKIAENQFADNRNQIRLQVEQAYFSLQANDENIATTEKALGQAEESLRLANLRFKAGVGTQTDVINSETALTTAKVNRLQAILGYNRALATLQRAISNLSN